MSGPQMQVHRFWKSYKQNPDDPGTLKEVHWVEYGPLGNKARMTNINTVGEIIDRLQPLEGSSDPAVVIAHMRADFIRKAYQSWLAGEEMPVNGTPLAAWNALSPEQAEAIKLQGIKTVEEIAALTESTAARMPFPNKLEMVKLAKNFVESKDQTRLAAALTKKDEEIASLRLENEERDAREADLARKVDQLASLLAEKEQAETDEPVKRGRPRKQVEAAA